MKALVTGGTGFVGRALVRELVARGHGVRVLARGAERPEERLPEGVERTGGDATDPATLARAVTGCELVFHLAGVRRATERAEFMRVNAASTRRVLDACLAAGAGSRRFVLAGSIAAAGPSRTAKVESDPLQPVEWYGESKAEAERIALSYADRLPVAVARPPRIMGPGDRENLFFFRLAARGVVVGITGAPRPISWVDVSDCARGLALLAEHPAAVGEAFFIASPERTDLEALQRGIAAALGVRPRTVRLPPAALRAAAAGADVVTRATGRRLPLNTKLARQILAPGWLCDPTRARERLGFEARVPLAASLAEAARWYRERGLL